MPKLYLYLDPKIAPERRLAFQQILGQLQPIVMQLEPALPETDSPEVASSATSSSKISAFPALCEQYLQHSTLLMAGRIASWDLVFLDQDAYTALLSEMKRAAKFKAKHKDAVQAHAFTQKVIGSPVAFDFNHEDLLIAFSSQGAGLTLLRDGKLNPLCLDFEHVAYRQRLLRGGRQREAVSRAVLQGIVNGALIFDATAGLGRESMILAHAGGRVLSFERQLPIWIILQDALIRAQHSRFFPFTLPTLHSLGTIKDYPLDAERPEVIYYDPMFPERESSAQVKKDMFIFQQVIGQDADTEEFLRYALTLARKRVVVKRPSFAPAVSATDLTCAYAVDGGQCRFDCYTV